MPFEIGNKAAVGSGGPIKNKPYRDALRLEALAVESGEECAAPKGSLRWIARKQLEKAGEDTAAAKEIADRLDGKVPQGHGGDDELPPISMQTIERVIVDPKHSDSEGLPPAT